MKTRLLFTAVLAGLIVMCADLYFKTHLAEVTQNPGTFLGLALPNALLVLLHIVILTAGLIFAVMYIQSAGWRALAVFVLVSTTSNLVDRLLIGAVVDYLYVFGIWFNLADLVVSAGIAAVVVRALSSK